LRPPLPMKVGSSRQRLTRNCGTRRKICPGRWRWGRLSSWPSIFCIMWALPAPCPTRFWWKAASRARGLPLWPFSANGAACFWWSLWSFPVSGL